MTTNRLARSSSPIDHDKNPLTNPVMARQWARWAREAGKSDLAAKWDQHAHQLEGGLQISGKMMAAGEG